METVPFEEPRYSIVYSKIIPQILFQEGISILISTYQAGRVIVVTAKTEDRLTQTPVPFKKPMGIALRDDLMAVATLDEVQIYERTTAMAAGLPEAKEKYDTLFLPRAVYYSGKTDLHDIAFGKGGLWAANTGYSCLSTYDVSHSFRPKWKPNFISQIAPGDRCHLNGMASEDGVPCFVTALGKSDKPQGWREDIINGGVLMRVPSGEIILEGLGMPHSPRLIDGVLYVLLSATGQIIRVNPDEKTYEVLFETERLIRGMCHWKNYLFVGMSKGRETSKTFNKLPVAGNSTHAGLLIFDIEKGVLLGELKYETSVDEIFDVQVIDSRMPAIVPVSDERRQKAITIPGGGFWI